MVLLSLALSLAWMAFMVTGINQMAEQDRNNASHARLVGCTLLGKSSAVPAVMYFDCRGNVEMHREIDWTKTISR